jgi:hypothetical protein
LLFVAAVAQVPSPDLRAQDRSKTVLVHYMPWYASKPVSGHWGWHWTMNHFDPDRVRADGQREVASHDYPLIGLYDSNDADALECQVLLMKLAGIDGVIIDWYGTAHFRDYPDVHRNTQHFIKHVRKAGLQYAVCYEDQTVKYMKEAELLRDQQDIAQGQKDLAWLTDNCFSDDAYVKIKGRPVLLIFGPQYFQKNQWARMVTELNQRPLLFGLPHLVQQNGLDGAYGWPPVTGGVEIVPDVWRKYLESLHARPDADKFVISVAFPEFRDIYEQAELHDSYGSIDDRDGATFADTLNMAQESRSRIIQIATWNDYGEGTMIEPTKASGYRYLEHVRKHTENNEAYSADDLRLPVMVYQLKKKLSQNAARGVQLKKATDLLFAGDCNKARLILESVAKDE